MSLISDFNPAFATSMMASHIASSSLTEPIDLAEYLFTRLHQAGVKSVHGVPGDYNLVALDYIPKAGMHWVGNCNELNAGYAADGYGKINGLAAIVTTFGVGELSAMNALAGAYSEFSPVVHIVGCPSTAAQRDGMLLHHTLGNGDFGVFKDMAARVSVAVAELDDARTAAQLVDEAIVQCWVRSRPAYVWLPTDMVKCKVEGAKLKTPLKLEYPPNDKEKEDYVSEVVLRHLRESKTAIVLVDACAIRHRALDEVKDFLAASGLPVVTSPMGKGAIDESSANYCGIYAGGITRPELKERVESADLVLTVGSVKSDFNTAGFTYRISQLATVDLHSTMTRVKYSEYPGVRMRGVLRQLAARIRAEKLPHVTPGPKPDSRVPAKDADPTITHAWMWPQLGNWFRTGDVVVTETGTSNFGILDSRFPDGVRAVNQYLWGSIGYATPAAQGAALAVRDNGSGTCSHGTQHGHRRDGQHGGDGRTVLWTGDGSIQLTAQSISTMLRNGLAPVIFVICNSGYTIERFIHGMGAAYNDVADWRYGDLPAVFGAGQGKSRSYVVKTKAEFEALLADKEFSDPESGVLRLVEVFMDKEDAPMAMKVTAAAAKGG